MIWTKKSDQSQNWNFPKIDFFKWSSETCCVHKMYKLYRTAWVKMGEIFTQLCSKLLFTVKFWQRKIYIKNYLQKLFKWILRDWTLIIEVIDENIVNLYRCKKWFCQIPRNSCQLIKISYWSENSNPKSHFISETDHFDLVEKLKEKDSKFRNWKLNLKVNKWKIILERVTIILNKKFIKI